MGTVRSSQDEIFNVAAELASAAERAAYLDEACAHDAALREEIEDLLARDQEAGSFLESPHPWLDATTIHPVSEQPGDTIGPYTLVEQIGQGGMGVVYRAKQTQPIKRSVALKVIKPGMDSQAVIARFQAERQALALMDHPHIAKVLDAGATDSGRPYFVLELVKGIPITDYCDGCAYSTRDRLELFVQVCQAINHAHERGIIHRDVKPSNVLIEMRDGEPAPKIIDFGVAKAMGQRLTEHTLTTGFAQMLGTPLYMSPEQAEMSPVDVDVRSDVYSLGVLLYQLLTGTTPFDEDRLRTADFDELRRIIREEDPPKPSTRFSTLGDRAATIAENRRTQPHRLQRLLRGDLDWIVMKALEKDPRHRYVSANALAADVQRYLADRPTLARPPSLTGRAVKWSRRHTALVMSSAIILLVSTVALAVSTYLITGAYHTAEENFQTSEEQQREARQARIESDQAAARAETARQAETRQRIKAESSDREARRRLYAAEMKIATQATDTGNEFTLYRLLQKHIPGPGEEDLRGFEWYYLWAGRSVQRYFQPGIAGPFRTVAYSPDGTTLATAGGGSIKLWATASGREVLSIDSQFNSIRQIEFSPDGRRLAAAAYGPVKIWDLNTRDALTVIAERDRRITYLAFSPDGSTLATANSTSDIRLWDTASGRLRNTLSQNQTERAVAFSPDGATLASVGRRYVTLWNVATNEPIRLAVNGYSGSVGPCIEFSPDGRFLAACGTYGSVMLWDAATKERIPTFEDYPTDASSLTFSPDSRALALLGNDGSIRLWDIAGAEKVSALEGLTQSDGGPPAQGLAFSPSGQSLAFWGRERVGVWDLSREPNPAVISVPGGVDALAFSPDGRTLAAGGDRIVLFYDTATGEPFWSITAPGRPIDSLSFSPDGRRIAFVDSGRTMQIRDLTSTGDEIKHRFSGGTPQVVFSHDGSEVIGCARASDVRMWNVDSGRQRSTHLTLEHYIRSLAASSDGRMLAAAISVAGVLMYDLMSEKDLPNVWIGDNVPKTVAFSPDNRTLAIGLSDARVILFDIGTHSRAAVMSGHGGPVTSVAFAPDGRTLASASVDRTVRLWDPITGQERATFQEHTGPINAIAFSPDGRVLASGSSDGTILLWRASAAETTTVDERLPPAVRKASAGREMATFKAHADRVVSVLFSRDGRRLATASWDTLIRFWDVTSGSMLSILSHPAPMESIALSADGLTLASAGRYSKPRLWDAATGELTREMADQPFEARAFPKCVAFSPDGQTVATGHNVFHPVVTLWEVSTGTPMAVLNGHTAQVRSVAYSPDGGTLASAGSDCTIILWDPDSGEPRDTLDGHTHTVADVTFSPNGETLASASHDGTVILWDAAGGERRSTLRGHNAEALAVAFSPDGQRIATGAALRQGDDLRGEAIVWDLQTGEPELAFPGHKGPVFSVDFSPDGMTLATGDATGEVRLWNVRDDFEPLLSTDPAADDDGPAATPPATDEGSPSPATGPESGSEPTLLEWARQPEMREELAGQYRDVLEKRSSGDGLAAARVALAIAARYAQAFPAAAGFRDALADHHHLLANELVAAKQADEAEQAYKQAIDIWQRLIAEFPDHQGYNTSLAEALFDRGRLLMDAGEFQRAHDDYYRILELKAANAFDLNNVAWDLATSADHQQSEPTLAVGLAQRAVELESANGMCWNTLGVAQYRAGDFTSAIASLQKSRQLLDGAHDSWNLFFLATANWQLGQHDQATDFYDEAIEWMKTNQQEQEELIRFRNEASELMGRPDSRDGPQATDGSIETNEKTADESPGPP